MHRFVAFAFSLLIALPAALFDVTARFVVSALELFKPDPERFDDPAFGIDYAVSGDSLPSSLLNSLRHEANVSRRSAARGI